MTLVGRRGMLMFLEALALRDPGGRQTILISGGTSTGKTTLLNALAATCLPADERIVVIEDTAELQIDRPNLVRFEARRAQPDVPATTIRDLLRASLRHRPDRIILGEVRGGEAFDLVQARNTGHAGSLLGRFMRMGPSRLWRGWPPAWCRAGSTCLMPPCEARLPMR